MRWFKISFITCPNMFSNNLTCTTNFRCVHNNHRPLGFVAQCSIFCSGCQAMASLFQDEADEPSPSRLFQNEQSDSDADHEQGHHHAAQATTTPASASLFQDEPNEVVQPHQAEPVEPYLFGDEASESFEKICYTFQVCYLVFTG